MNYPTHSDLEIFQDADLSKYSTVRLKAHGDLIVAKSIDALKFILTWLNQHKVAPIILGLGANTLLDESSERPYLQIDLPFEKTLLDAIQEEYDLPASVRLSVLSSHAIKFGLKGWEGITGIPATLGGAIAMNAGTGLGEIGQIVKDVTILNFAGEERIHLIDESSFSYRANHFLSPGDIIVSARLKNLGIDPKVSEVIKEYLALRNSSQPLKEWTCGCVFKNNVGKELTCRAGHFIDIIGFKGIEIDGVRVSSKHANFMENIGDATKGQYIRLIELIQDELELQYGIKFETEVKI